MDESLITPPIDLSGVTNATLEFDHYFNQYEAEVADVDVRSSVTGGAWVNVARFTADSANPAAASIDITAEAAGAADVEIRWRYYNADFEWYWYVDNVRVSFTSPGGCAMLPCGLTGPPAEQAGERWPDRDTLAWDVDPFATEGYTVYRGTKATLPNLLGPASDSCVRFTSTAAAENAADLTADDPTTALGRLYWYLVTGRNALGEGPAGAASAGPRQVDATGPCP
jgi:hypothetical protein